MTSVSRRMAKRAWSMPANMRETTVEWAGAHGFTSDKALNFFLERYEAAYRNELDAFVGAVKAGTQAPSRRRGRPQGASARRRGLPVMEDQPARYGGLIAGVAAHRRVQGLALAPEAAWSYRRRRRQREAGMAQAAETTPGLELGAERSAAAQAAAIRRAPDRSRHAASPDASTARRGGERHHHRRFRDDFCAHAGPRRPGQVQGGDRRDERRSDHALLRLHGVELPRAHRL